MIAVGEHQAGRQGVHSTMCEREGRTTKAERGQHRRVSDRAERENRAEARRAGDLGREMEEIRSDGHAGCKMKVGGRSPREDAERVRVARKATGDDFILIVDANQGWTRRQAA